MDAMDMKEQAEEIAEGPKPSRFNQAVAIAVAVVAVFMALCKVKDDNIVQAMMAAQAQELDLWNHYQAKSTKQHLYEIQSEQWQLQADLSPSASARARMDDQLKKWRAEVARYDKEKTALKDKAESARREYDRLNFRDDQFDFSDALMSLAIALLATSSLTRSRALFGMGAAIAIGGVIMGLAGFFGWGIHPHVIRFLN